MSQVVVFRRRGGNVPPVAAARDRTVAPPLSEGAIEEWSLDPLLSNVWGVKKLADKIDRKMQELSDGKGVGIASHLQFQSLRKDMRNMHKDISTVYDKLRNITEKCLLDKLEDLVPGGRHARRPGDRIGRELSQPGSRSRSPRGRQGPRSPGARGHSWSSEPEVSSAPSRTSTPAGSFPFAPSITKRQPSDYEDADEPINDVLRPWLDDDDQAEDVGCVRLSELASRGFQRWIHPSFGLRFYPRHIAECLATPVYSEVEFRNRIENFHRRVLQEMLVAAAFPNSPNEARINRPLGIPVDMGVPPRVPPPRY